MPNPATVHTLDNGLVLLVERVDGVRSAALSMLVPAGVATDPADAVGLSNVLQEMTMRGAGDRSSREFSDALDRLGIQRGCSVGIYHARYTAAATARNLLDALPLFADLVRRPTLADDQFEPSQQLVLQEIDGLSDDPRSLAMIELRRVAWPEPLGRNTVGELAHVEALTADRCRAEHARRFRPGGTILSIAGDIDPAEAIARVEQWFADWQGDASLIDPPLAAPQTQSTFLRQASEQTHIGIACPSVPERHPDYYVARVANEVLSGGSSGRLFTEIREKRGLCYSVGTSYAPLRDRASLLGYAGTSNDRAQATLDGMIEEMTKLADGVTAEEVERQKVGLLSNTVMSIESTGARAGMNAGDYFSRGRLRPIEEIVAEIERVDADAINELLAREPLGPFTVVTVGPHELTVLGEAVAEKDVA